MKNSAFSSLLSTDEVIMTSNMMSPELKNKTNAHSNVQRTFYRKRTLFKAFSVQNLLHHIHLMCFLSTKKVPLLWYTSEISILSIFIKPCTHLCQRTSSRTVTAHTEIIVSSAN